MGLIQRLIDYIYEKSSQLVEYVLNLFNSLDKIAKSLLPE